MFEMRVVFTLICLSLSFIPTIEGHGRLWDPPGRASMWRRGYNTPKNYNDNQLFCGGFSYQWGSHGGKCGVCGDPYGKPQPRPHEAGGTYASGIITRTYNESQIIEVDVQVTANHLGFFQFRMCPNNNVKKIVTQKCLDNHLLSLADGSGTKYHISSAVGHYKVKLQLPVGLTCSQCVLQWKWHTGNSWGTNQNDHRSCVGCGAQEEFYGCADVSVQASGGAIQSPTTTTTSSSVSTTTAAILTTTTSTTLQPTTTTPKQTTTTTPLSTTTSSTTHLPTTPQPTATSSTTPKPTTPTTPKPTTSTTPKPTTPTHQPTTTSSTTSLPTTTTPKPTITSSTTSLPTTTTPKPTITSSSTPKPTNTTIILSTTTKPTTISTTTTTTTTTAATTTTTPKPIPQVFIPITTTKPRACRIKPSIVYGRVPGMQWWCNINCSRGFCPKSHCRCV